MDSEKIAEEHPVVPEEFPRKVRIETQIHRRRAAKALSHLTLEWEQAQSALPDQHEDQERVVSDQLVPQCRARKFLTPR